MPTEGKSQPIEELSASENLTPDESSNDEKTSSLKPSLNHFVFWPPFLLMLAAVALNLINPKRFEAIIGWADNGLRHYFGWLYSLCALSAFLVCVWICFSKFGQVRLGGRNAKPLMSLWNWFAIAICTTVAVGLLFWSTAEPIAHYHSPPSSLGIEPETPAAAKFALSTMYMHWTFVPYAIYCVAALMFAFAYYNMKQPFSLGSTLVPLLGERFTRKNGNLIDAICLYSLVAGMSATLGTGIKTIASGLNSLFDVPDNRFVWGLIALTIVATFIASSATGLMNGIRILSDLNTRALMVLAVLIFCMGPTMFIIGGGVEAMGSFLTHFFERSLLTGTIASDPWPGNWTLFYWAVWLAWTPITACFLGRIAYGRTVREFMLVNFIAPSIFCIVWMSIFSGTALSMEMNGGNLGQVYATLSEGAVSYKVFESFWCGTALVVFYLVSSFVCFVTSADSNTTAMASISSKNVSLENPEGNLKIKVAWGLMVGAVAWVMISYAGVAGIKTLSNLGGFPALWLVLLIMASLVKVIVNVEKYDLVDIDAIQDERTDFNHKIQQEKGSSL